jgi:putative redox protein
MTYTATAQPINGTLQQEIDVNGRHTIITDEPAHLGGTDTAPTPHELLAATLASCVSTMLVLYAKPRDIDLGDLRVEVDYDADTTPRQVEIAIHLPDHLTDDQVKRLEKVAETCPVRRALEAGFTFNERLVTTRSPTHVGT